MTASAERRWRPPARVRPLSVGIVRRGRALLLMAARDDAGRLKGWRPVGGEIEFGETAAAALAREFMEELGAAVDVGERLGVLENHFEHEGARGHEVVFVFAVHAPELATRDRFEPIVDGGVEAAFAWIEDPDPLFPPGLAALIAG